jgi:hypothetical protein
MRDLTNIILAKKSDLPSKVEKTVNQLYNKIKGGNYLPDNKNVIKLKDIATAETTNFLLACLTEYDVTPRTAIEHHDTTGLKATWATLAFSKEEHVIRYFDELIDRYSKEKPFYLSFLFEIFSYPEIQHPLYDKIKKYYDEISEDLPAYKVLKKLKIEPPNRYDWSVSLTLTTDGEWLTPSNLTDEQKEKRFALELWIGSPRILNNTFRIDVKNDLSSKKRRILFEESDILTIDVDSSKIENPNLLKLNSFMDGIERYFDVKFDFEKIAYISVSKGINKRLIEKWIKNRFAI